MLEADADCSAEIKWCLQQMIKLFYPSLVPGVKYEQVSARLLYKEE